MLFSEIYSSYFNAVAKILGLATESKLTGKALTEAIQEQAFEESVLVIPKALKSERWPLLTRTFETPLLEKPTMPLTDLQKQWLKALLKDPRIGLFSPSTEGLEDVEPLYDPESVVFFDRYGDGDPFQDRNYIRNFQTILQALRENGSVRIRYRAAGGSERRYDCHPIHLEYSGRDDKFRLIAEGWKRILTLKLGRMISVERREKWETQSGELPENGEKEMTLELTDERDAMRRAIISFSDLEKETIRLDEKHYRIHLWYRQEDETDLLIRILSFGPVLRVTEPAELVDQVIARLRRQRDYSI